MLFIAGRAAMGSAPLLMTLVWNFFVVILPVLAILLLLSPALVTTEIVISKGGVFFKRRLRPITIQKITDLEVVKFGGRKVKVMGEEGLKITGLTPAGKKFHKTIGKTGDLSKRWEEFKGDLRKIRSK